MKRPASTKSLSPFLSRSTSYGALLNAASSSGISLPTSNKNETSTSSKSSFTRVQQKHNNQNDEASVDLIEEEIITIALRDVVSNAYGIVAAEVWVVETHNTESTMSTSDASSIFTSMNSLSSLTNSLTLVPRINKYFGEKTKHTQQNYSSGVKLIQPPGGFVIDDMFQYSNNVNKDILRKLQDPKHEHYSPAVDTIPGVGLAGIMWTDDHDANNIISNKADEKNCTWRSLKTISSDPEQHPDQRTYLLSLVFGKAAAFSFNIRSHRGLVIYFARGSSLENDLSSDENLHYLRGSTDLIGAVSAWHLPRQNVLKSRAKRRRRQKSILRSLSNHIFYDTSEYNDERENGSMSTSGIHKNFFYLSWGFIQNWMKITSHEIGENVSIWKRKFRGGLKPPPPSSSSQAIITAVGAFVTLVIISYFSQLCTVAVDHSVILAPFGALVTLQYALTSAPMGQPRNTILGQACSMLIGILFTYIPEYYLPSWMRVAVAPAVAIGVMARLGIQHPPAGAAAIAFTQSRATWINLAINLTASAMAILVSASYNNMYRNRQYPTYWGFDSSFLFEYPGVLSGFVKRRTRPDRKESIDSLPADTFMNNVERGDSFILSF